MGRDSKHLVDEVTTATFEQESLLDEMSAMRCDLGSEHINSAPRGGLGGHHWIGRARTAGIEQSFGTKRVTQASATTRALGAELPPDEIVIAGGLLSLSGAAGEARTVESESIDVHEGRGSRG